ncbi:MAG: DUF2662 domain-containing protein [Micrococcales bacterium]|nr:DUF2662 domain-containing protein [Micrococcales bacterium]NBR62307.1 DUF2662 domain-containing protein [Actinomycetota bacterium]NBS61404.1 DUF2662 domain-containing protein [Microbacteriaceae bacterium]NBT48392.1 DUF2662 domain-containing protein [Actinomycetota bacterium]NBY43707.1 DUF2662 domain-containing protein [Micrococcales bacterium]
MNALGFIEKFERRLERFVNGAFSKAFKSQLQPVEISSAIKAKMDAGAAVVDRERILAPDTYKVRLSPGDYSRLKQLGKALNEEVESKVKAHAKKQRYQFPGSLSIDMESDSALSVGQLRVSASGSKAPDIASVTWRPALDINGKRYLLAKSRTTVGRDASADLPINDTGLSRTHFAINWDGTTATIEDLGSTNGTKVSGIKITSQTLVPDTVISAGRTDFVFRVIANGDTK